MSSLRLAVRCTTAALLLHVSAAPLRAQAVPTAPAPTPADTAPRDTAARPDSLSADSLRARLARAEAAIDLLREQLAGESESTVHTRSRVRVDVFARVLTNAFMTWGRANITDVPLNVLAPAGAPARAPTNDALGLSVRQTRVGAVTSVQDVLGGVFSGDVDLDFFGGVSNGPGDRRLFPEPRLRTARARIIWARAELMVGSDTPLISDLNPVSLAGVAIPVFSSAANLWNWIPQVRFTREAGSVGRGDSRLHFAVQGALLAPYTSTVAPDDPDAVDIGERSRRPALEARIRARWGDEEGGLSDVMIGDAGGEIGVGTHRGWVATAPGVMQASYAYSVDGHAVLAHGVELRGEAYVGRLLRGLGGGGAGQNFGQPLPGSPAGTLGPPVRDMAGWLQVNVQPHPIVITGAGCGIDVVNPDDRPVRRQNTVCEAHLHWRPAQPLVLGLEYRQLASRYASGTFGVRHLNVAFGFDL